MTSNEVIMDLEKKERVMKHRAKNGDWAERKRIWRHPLLGERLHHIAMGFITIRKVWNQREHWAHVEPHDRAYLVYEYVTDTGMHYIDDGWHLLGQCQMADGSNINEYITRKTGEPPFVGKSRFDARPDRCAKCPAQMRSSTQEEKNLYENMLARMSTPIDVDIFAYDDVTAHAAECARRCGSDDEGD